ncbi:MAG: iron-siderophore ABC transporter substrate-binding protein [Actinomycetota bacterium]
MLRLRSLSVILACFAIVAAACGGSDSDDAADGTAADSQDTQVAGTTETVEPSSTEAAPTDTTTPTEAPDPTAAAPDSTVDGTEPPETDPAPVDTGTDTDSEDGVRTVVDGFGDEIEVPVDPQRIVVLNPGTILPTYLELGAPVVASNIPTDDFATAVLPAEDLASIESVGFPTPSLELVAAQDPDIIVFFAPGDADLVDELREIAPTVAAEFDLNDWRVSGRSAADAIGQADEFDALVAEYDQREAALADALGDRLDDEVSIVRALGDAVRMHTRFHFAGQVIDSIGMARTPEQQTDDPAVRNIQISLEEIDQVDGDILFMFGAGLDDAAIQSSLDEVQQSPLWNTLEVVQNDRVFIVDTLAWQQGGLRAAELILADVAAAYGVGG